MQRFGKRNFNEIGETYMVDACYITLQHKAIENLLENIN